VDGINKNLGRKPKEASADAGYCSEANLNALADRGIALTHSMSQMGHNQTCCPLNGALAADRWADPRGP
jgi:hypothetical protein